MNIGRFILLLLTLVLRLGIWLCAMYAGFMALTGGVMYVISGGRTWETLAVAGGGFLLCCVLMGFLKVQQDLLLRAMTRVARRRDEPFADPRGYEGGGMYWNLTVPAKREGRF